MVKALSVFAAVMAIAFVSVFIFAGIYGSAYAGTISDIKINEIQNKFDVKYSVIEDYYGNPLAVVKIEEGLYLDAKEFADNFKNGGTYITAYEVENGKAVNQSTLVITFTGSGNKLEKLMKSIPAIKTNAQTD
ncbi:MAG: hypothetical protein Q4Q53_02040 [Methanocorpusculum sp.]|nr:hypothetical protein [Methanocorpusculum sp.]